MSADDPDLFGKIDALLGKRAPDALLEKELDIEDFPLLTEVVDSVPDVLSGADRRLRERRQTGRCDQESTVEARDAASLSDMNAEMQSLMIAIEQRLVALFSRRQLQMEEELRGVIRDEIRREIARYRHDQP